MHSWLRSRWPLVRLSAAWILIALPVVAQDAIVDTAVRHDTSPRLSGMRALTPDKEAPLRVIPIDLVPTRTQGPRAPLNLDPVVQSARSGSRAPIVDAGDFEGLGRTFPPPNGDFVVRSVPPDISGAVGRTQYVQAVNASFAVFDKATGLPLHGPADIKTLFSGFGGPCEEENDGDPIVEYDRWAGRWIITQFQVSQGNSQCVAVSATEDATGSYHRYEFRYDKMNDYPKLGVWPDAYYITFNMFRPASGARACAYERAKMLVGQVPRQVCFQLSTAFWSLLPADSEGGAPPPAGTPNPMLSLGPASRSLDLWNFSVNWTNPALSTFGAGANHLPNRSIAVAPFNDACSGTNCIPQKGTPNKLDSLGERLMQQASYRRYANHNSLVVNHSVAVANSTAMSGVRWYELRDVHGTPVVFQQGTFAPDAVSRWMGSAAMDGAGNLLIGYSASSADMFPAIRVAGRTPADALGTLSTEMTVIDGGGSQTQHERWGDYSPMSVDPSDDCTFWYSTEYLAETGVFNWHTRISRHRFSTCGGGGGDPAPAPSSQRMLYTATQSGNRDVYAVTVPAGSIVRLTSHAAADYAPAASPDGRSILFLSERDGSPEIYVMNADGSSQRRLTTNTIREEDVAWFPGSTSAPIMAIAEGVASRNIDMPAGAPAPRPTAWGGDGAMLSVHEKGATLDLGCDVGELLAPLPASGAFDIPGIYEMQPGGPDGPDANAIRRVAARFIGRVDGERVTLRVVPEGATGPIGPLTLQRGRQSRVVRCAPPVVR